MTFKVKKRSSLWSSELHVKSPTSEMFRQTRRGCLLLFACAPVRALSVAHPPSVQKPAELVGICSRESSTVIGTATRAEVRAQNLPHRCSYCLVVDGAEKRVLVQKRVAWKETYPSHHDPCPGGVMGPEETFEENPSDSEQEDAAIEAFAAGLRQGRG